MLLPLKGLGPLTHCCFQLHSNAKPVLGGNDLGCSVIIIECMKISQYGLDKVGHSLAFGKNHLQCGVKSDLPNSKSAKFSRLFPKY